MRLYLSKINKADIIPLVEDLEILNIFKDEDKEEGDSVTTTRRGVRSS